MSASDNPKSQYKHFAIVIGDPSPVMVTPDKTGEFTRKQNLSSKSIIEADWPTAKAKGRIFIDSYKIRPDFITLEDYRMQWGVRQLDESAGLIAKLDENQLTHDESLGVLEFIGHGYYIKEDVDLLQLPHYYYFEDAEKERKWIIEAVLEGSSPKGHNGRPVRLSSDVIKDATERIHTHLSEIIGPVLDDERAELARLEEQKAKAIEAHKRANREALSFANDLKSKQEEERELDRLLSQKKDDQKTLDSTIESTRKRLERLKGQVQVYKKCLEEWRAHQTSEDSKIEAHAEKLKACDSIEDEVEAVRHLVKELEHRASPADIIALHVSLKLFPFTVLTGPSGTGKSSLLQLYAQAMGMYCTLIPVQPNWTSVADLHGYVTYIGKQRFVQTPFSRALGRQCAKHEFVDLVILDEINLSQVEYFMADYLSAFETGERRVRLANADELEELAEGRIPEWLKATWGEVYVPPTLLIAGTANEDHTTRPFSEKFRDRAAIMPLEGLQTNATISLVDRERTSESIKPIRIAPAIFKQWQDNPPGQPEGVQDALKLAGQTLEDIRKITKLPSHRSPRDITAFIEHAYPLLEATDVKEPEKVAVDYALAIRLVQKLSASSVKNLDKPKLRESLSNKGYNQAAALLSANHL